MSGSTTHILGVEKFYTAYQPNLTTSKSGIIFFNSSNLEEDNAFTAKLQDAYRKSATHSNFIKLKASLIAGSGLFPVDDNDSVTAEFLKKENRVGMTPDEVWKKCAFDLAMYDALCTQVTYSSENKMVEVYHTNPANIRAGEPDSELGNITKWFYSTTWGNITNKKSKKKMNDVANATEIPSFNPANGSTDGRQLFYATNYSSSNDVYGLPQYCSALNFIEIENSISDYMVNKIKGGFFPSGILYIPSNMSVEEQEKFIGEFKGSFVGVENAGRIVYSFGDTTRAKPEYIPLSDNLTNAFVKDLITLAQLQISISHGGSMSLLGVDAGDSFGTNADANKLNIARLYFIDTVIKSYQSIALAAFNRMLAAAGCGPVTVMNDSLKLQQPMVDLNDLTIDERREMAYGLNPLPKATEPTNNPIPTPPIV